MVPVFYVLLEFLLQIAEQITAEEIRNGNV